MENNYVLLSFTHKSFTTGKAAIVAISDKCEMIADYEKLAKEKVCDKFSLSENEVIVFDCCFLGKNIIFID